MPVCVCVHRMAANAQKPRAQVWSFFGFGPTHMPKLLAPHPEKTYLLGFRMMVSLYSSLKG